jgi:hypothetical protein
MSTLPSRGRLIGFAVLLPAVVAGSNQLSFILTSSFGGPHWWLYPWMVLSTAVLSWCTGRYLSPAWFRWVVFVWCLALVDILTIWACLSHRVEQDFGYIVVSSQISLLVLWAVLGTGTWQLRLPSVAAVVPLVIVFANSISTNRYVSHNWDVMMLITAPAVAMVCGGLRYLGFLLVPQSTGSESRGQGRRPTYQFGTKHMLIWLTVTGPLLLVVRSIDFDGQTAFPAALVATSVATVNLLAIWAVLGGGHWIIRSAFVLGIPFLIANGMTYYSAYLKTIAVQYRSISYTLMNMEEHWFEWLWLDAALLAALLLFLRASGYRLMRSNENNQV